MGGQGKKGKWKKECAKNVKNVFAQHLPVMISLHTHTLININMIITIACIIFIATIIIYLVWLTTIVNWRKCFPTFSSFYFQIVLFFRLISHAGVYCYGD